MNYLYASLIIYLYASIPFSLLVGFAYGKDIRTEGSKNVGGSNLGRTCGKMAFVYGFLLDFSKGAVAALVASYFGVNPFLCALIAVAAHSFSVWINFKGGKGVATAFGFVVVYSFWAAMFAITVFLIVLKTTKYISLSSIIAIGAYVGYEIFMQNWPNVIFGFVIWTAIILLHRKNIVRLKNGTETKITWM